MTDLTHEALEARKTLTDAIGDGASDAVLVSSEPDGPGLWTSGLKRAVFGAVAAAMVIGAAAGGQSVGQSLFDQMNGSQDEISYQMDEASIEAFADQIGPKIFGRDLFGNGQMVLHVGETGTDDDARFFTSLDPQAVGVNVDQDNECYAMYQPALRDALGSDLRLQNTMESFALGHCLMAGGEPGSVSNIIGEADLDRMMMNLAAARLIEGNVLGEDGRDLSDSSSVRDAWFASQFSQDSASGAANDFDGVAAYTVLKRADETLLVYGQPGTLSELRDQVFAVVENGFGDMTPLVRSLDTDMPAEHLVRINEALRDVYNGSPAETRLDRMDDFMRDPVAATAKIEAGGFDAYLEGLSSRASLDGVRVDDPFAAPVVTLSMDNVQVQSPFELRPEADVSFEDGPKF
jgi:hypothetical protein